MKKKWLIIFIAIVLAITPTMSVSATKYPEASVTVDGEKLKVPAYIINKSTFVPYSVIFQKLGATVSWNNNEKSATATKGKTNIKLTVGKSEALLNGQVRSLSAVPINLNGSVYVPLRFVSDALGASVNFNSATKTAIIRSNNVVSSSSQTTPAPTPTPNPTTVTVKATNFDWELSQTVFKVNEEITFQITSTEGFHGFELSDTSIDVNLPLDSTVTVKWTPTKPGTYTIRCTVFCGSGHGAMRTTITVES
jgi:cytochrome c oxidase subunit 2